MYFIEPRRVPEKQKSFGKFYLDTNIFVYTYPCFAKILLHSKCACPQCNIYVFVWQNTYPLFFQTLSIKEKIEDFDNYNNR